MANWLNSKNVAEKETVLWALNNQSKLMGVIRSKEYTANIDQDTEERYWKFVVLLQSKYEDFSDEYQTSEKYPLEAYVLSRTKYYMNEEAVKYYKKAKKESYAISRENYEKGDSVPKGCVVLDENVEVDERFSQVDSYDCFEECKNVAKPYSDLIGIDIVKLMKDVIEKNMREEDVAMDLGLTSNEYTNIIKSLKNAEKYMNEAESTVQEALGMKVNIRSIEKIFEAMNKVFLVNMKVIKPKEDEGMVDINIEQIPQRFIQIKKALKSFYRYKNFKDTKDFMLRYARNLSETGKSLAEM